MPTLSLAVSLTISEAVTSLLVVMFWPAVSVTFSEAVTSLLVVMFWPAVSVTSPWKSSALPVASTTPVLERSPLVAVRVTDLPLTASKTASFMALTITSPSSDFKPLEA